MFVFTSGGLKLEYFDIWTTVVCPCYDYNKNNVGTFDLFDYILVSPLSSRKLHADVVVFSI